MGAQFWTTFCASKKALACFLALDAALLFAYAPTLGVSAGEARLFFGDEGAIGHILRFSASLFGQNNLAIRAPFILTHIFNAAMIYAVARRSMRPSDALIATIFFALLPGVNSAALLASMAPFAMSVALIYVWLSDRYEPLAIAALFLSAIADNLFIALNIAAACYEISRSRKRQAVLFICFAALSFALHSFEFGGRPRGYFLDIFGLYGAIFSPFILCYFIYTIYWYLFKNSEKLPALWFVSFAPFALSILLSMRQNLPIEEYAPFAAISTPLMTRAFMNSWRIRLPQFRKMHITLAVVFITSLLALGALTFFNKAIYAITDKHFARAHHFAQELSQTLKAKNIYAVQCSSQSLAIRLRFYGIESGGGYILSVKKPPDDQAAEAIEFFVFNARAAVFYLSAVPNASANDDAPRNPAPELRDELEIEKLRSQRREN
ncbi:MAG: glycosyltransferase family 39 protein [Helicobacteraceae bacterium]|jgi:hypothetical protein|nr:glycosyltransferase family 39 protein [Helicobacteraceae bacterium]